MTRYRLAIFDFDGTLWRDNIAECFHRSSCANFLSCPQRPAPEIVVALHAADEHELRHGPEDRLNRMLVDTARVVQQRDVRRKIRVRHPSQPASRQRGAEHPPKRFQPTQSILSDQDKRTIARPAPEPRGAVERNLEWLGPHFHGCLASRPNMALA